MADTQFCTNCKKQIVSSNFTMHELHCHRNIILCKTCDEPVPKSQIEEHNLIHAKTQCPLCSEEMEVSKLEIHEEQLCPKRHVKCSLCEIETPFDQYEEHVNYCESRTQQCPKCRQYIMMKDLNAHESSNCELPETTNHRNEDTLETDGVVDGPPAVLRESSFVAKELNRIFNYPNSQAYNLDYNYGVAAVDIPLDYESTMLPCEFCNALFPSDMIIAHQSSCPRGMTSTVVGDNLASMLHTGMSFHPRSDNFQFESPPYVEDSDDDTVDRLQTNDESAEILLPCEFCEELFSVSELPTHQADCPRDYLSSARGERTNHFMPEAPSDDNRPIAEEQTPVNNDQPSRSIDDFLRPIAVRRANQSSKPPTERPSGTGDRNEATPTIGFRAGMWSGMNESNSLHRSSDVNRTHGAEGTSRTYRTRNAEPSRRPGRGTRGAGVGNTRGRGSGQSSNSDVGRRMPRRTTYHKDELD